MTIYLPLWVVLAVAITLAWWGVGYLITNTLLVKLAYKNRRKLSGWYFPAGFIICGPVGWAVGVWYVIQR